MFRVNDPVIHYQMIPLQDVKKRSAIRSVRHKSLASGHRAWRLRTVANQRMRLYWWENLAICDGESSVLMIIMDQRPKFG